MSIEGTVVSDSSSRRKKAEVSADELMAALERSALPTVIVEGDDDVIIFRRLEQIFSDRSLSVQQAGGRATLLDIFRRRSSWKKSPKIIFIADRDIWIYSDIPKEYISNDLFFTDGYSIENDVLRDGQFVRLMDEREKENFMEEVRKFAFWYTHCICRHLKGEEVTDDLGTHPNQILGDQDRFVKPHHRLAEGEATSETYKLILEQFDRVMRGKSLMGILMRHISYILQRKSCATST
jgi:hypothetical protein